MNFDRNHWAVILGGSSGFGLATAQKLSRHGMNLCIVHRDRRGSIARIEADFEAIRANGVSLLAFNRDATSPAERDAMVGEIAERLGPNGRVRALLHSIAFGNLKSLAPPAAAPANEPAAVGVGRLAEALGVSPERVREAARQLADEGVDVLARLTPAAEMAGPLHEDDFAHTVHAMGTSLVGWVQSLREKNLFAADARVLSLTSEGNTLAWKGYAAVSAAKSVLESVSRSLAVEFAEYGLRTNVVQAGITDTAALRHIPGQEQMKAGARLRNPFRRLTTPQDVANVIFLLCTDEAAWINGALIRADGGEHVSGA